MLSKLLTPQAQFDGTTIPSYIAILGKAQKHLIFFKLLMTR
jgi:hypothetical protein